MKIRSALLSGCLFVVSSAGIAGAQPVQDAPAIAVNPPNAGANPQTPEEKQKMMEEAVKKGQDQAMAMLRMTPEERNAALHKLMEQSFRAQLNASGYKDVQLQDTLVKFINLQEQQREDVRREGQKVFKAIQTGVDDQNMDILVSNYLGAVEDAKAEREQDCKDLDAQIGYTTKPKLLALLNIMGLVGDSAFYTGDINMLGSMSYASLAGAFNQPPAVKPVVAPAPIADIPVAKNQ